MNGDEAGDEDFVAEEDLGEDVFAVAAVPVDVGDEEETWHGSDRDYLYSEVGSLTTPSKKGSIY